jgi:hypothetical protein
VKLTPEQLRVLYGHATAAAVDHPPADVLARLLAGEVTDDERRAAVTHVGRCSRCAEEVRVASAVADSLAGERQPAPVLRPAAWWRPAILLAAAAAVLVAGGLALRPSRPGQGPEASFRAGERPGLRSLVPPGARLSKAGSVLEWTGAPVGATFEVVLANERLDVLSRVSDLREPRLVVPGSVLSALAHGDRLVWRVTPVLPDGTHERSATFVNAVE